MKCSSCGKPVCHIDFDEGGLGSIPKDTLYHVEDTLWAFPPCPSSDDPLDPGMITCKPGTFPASMCAETQLFFNKLNEHKVCWEPIRRS